MCKKGPLGQCCLAPARRLCPPAGWSPGCPRRCVRPGGEPGAGRRRGSVSHAAEAQPGGPCPAPLGADPGRRRFPGSTGARTSAPRPSAVGTKPAAPPAALRGEAAAADEELLLPEGQLRFKPISPGSRTASPGCSAGYSPSPRCDVSRGGLAGSTGKRSSDGGSRAEPSDALAPGALRMLLLSNTHSLCACRGDPDRTAPVQNFQSIPKRRQTRIFYHLSLK
ncbi:hypothetical protein KIL84_023041 [Mauremys mutica]|uniref:Uncharacterized protein n=1 Tax=Mauremys mutica TaxID=74926 RepID=A0A9D3WQV2_9SAUR|nr:hypothetical protein KIL84_023041 [Mauremys mutica]